MRVGEKMLTTDHQRIEKFYDVLSQTTDILYRNLNLSFFEVLILSCNYILDGEVINDDLSSEVRYELETIYSQLKGEPFNKEEIRRAFQLSLLQGLKHENLNLSMITPDSIGLLFAYLINNLYPDTSTINILDGTIGSGNLLFSMLNNSHVEADLIYGVDQSYDFLEIALTLADLLDYPIELIHQDSRKPLVTPLFDLIIADLPNYPDLPEMANEIIANLMNYGKPGAFYLYLIPNDIFSNESSEELKSIILEQAHIQALIALPDDMFKSIDRAQSILILRKRDDNIEPIKDILVFNFPSFKDKEATEKAIDQLTNWFNNNIK